MDLISRQTIKAHTRLADGIKYPGNTNEIMPSGVPLGILNIGRNWKIFPANGKGEMRGGMAPCPLELAQAGGELQIREPRLHHGKPLQFGVNRT